MTSCFYGHHHAMFMLTDKFHIVLIYFLFFSLSVSVCFIQSWERQRSVKARSHGRKGKSRAQSWRTRRSKDRTVKLKRRRRKMRKRRRENTHRMMPTTTWCVFTPAFVCACSSNCDFYSLVRTFDIPTEKPDFRNSCFTVPLWFLYFHLLSPSVDQ